MWKSAIRHQGCNYSNMPVFPLQPSEREKVITEVMDTIVFSPLFALALPWYLVGVMISFIRLGAASDRKETVVMRRELFGTTGWKHWLCVAPTRASCWPTEGAAVHVSGPLGTDCGSRARCFVPVVKSIWSHWLSTARHFATCTSCNGSSLQDV